MSQWSTFQCDNFFLEWGTLQPVATIIRITFVLLILKRLLGHTHVYNWLHSQSNETVNGLYCYNKPDIVSRVCDYWICKLYLEVVIANKQTES